MTKCKWIITDKNSYSYTERSCGNNSKTLKMGGKGPGWNRSLPDNCPYCKQEVIVEIKEAE